MNQRLTELDRYKGKDPCLGRRELPLMPSFVDLLETAEIDRVLDYLTFMATQKTCADAAACAALVE